MKNVSFLLALSLMLTAGTALAVDQTKTAAPPAATMDHSKMDMSHAAMPHDMTDDAFTKLDANNDGKLSKAEMAKDSMVAHFGMLDANKDGSLTPAEYTSMHGM